MLLNLVIIRTEVSAINSREEVPTGNRRIIERGTGTNQAIFAIGIDERRAVGVE